MLKLQRHSKQYCFRLKIISVYL